MLTISTFEDEVPRENLETILTVENDLWKDEVPGIEEFYAKFGSKLPAAMQEQLDTLKANLG